MTCMSQHTHIWLQLTDVSGHATNKQYQQQRYGSAGVGGAYGGYGGMGGMGYGGGFQSW